MAAVIIAAELATSTRSRVRFKARMFILGALTAADIDMAAAKAHKINVKMQITVFDLFIPTPPFTNCVNYNSKLLTHSEQSVNI